MPIHRAQGNDPDLSDGAPLGIAILGEAVFYTTQTCGHIEAEFGVRCLRCCTIERLVLSEEPFETLRLLVVDQALSEDLLARPEAYRAIAPEASIALAYRDVKAARSFFRRCDTARHGEIGYLSMSAPLEVSLSSIRMLFHHEYFLPRSLLDDAPATDGPPCARASQYPAPVGDAELAAKFTRLTSREKEVLKLVSAGQSNKEIARRLGITEHTVKLHNHNLCQKIGVANRTAAAHIYYVVRKDADGVPS